MAVSWNAQRPSEQNIPVITEMLDDWDSWDYMFIQELGIRSDDDTEFDRKDTIDGDHYLVRNLRRPWHTAIVINKKWTNFDW